MYMKALPAQNKLNSLFSYSKETGVVTRKVKTGNNTVVGADVGCKNNMGQLVCGVEGKMYLVHRLVWVMLFGGIKKNNVIDHINGDRADNRLVNLRSVPHEINSRNMRTRGNSKSGYAGVNYYKSLGKWQARICVDGKSKHLGYFATVDDAVVVRRKAERRYGFINRDNK